MKKILLLLLLSYCTLPAFAVRKGNSELFLGVGLVSSNEFYGVTNTSKMGFPYCYSGAWFFTYRFFLTDHIAIGLSGGFDNVKGDVTQGNPKYNGGHDGNIGVYAHNCYTIAPEFFVKYAGWNVIMFYGYMGLGYSTSSITRGYSSDVIARTYQNGVVTYQLPPLEPDQNFSVYKLQVTPIGIRAGSTVAAFIEVGYGYKGLVNMGLSLKF